MCRMLLKKMCNLTCKKASMLVCASFVVILFTSYMLLFNHAPPEDILAANKLNRPQGRHLVRKDDSHLDELEKEIAEEERKASEYWENFITKHDYVSIGEIYDNCDEKDRVMIGKTIMLPDGIKHWGGVRGVMARTFVNLTIDEELNGGKFWIDVKYNGKELLNRNWELCTLDEDYGDDRIIYCPINPDEYSFVKDKAIPVYIPKGRYQTKGWITDEKDEIIACGFSDFTL